MNGTNWRHISFVEGQQQGVLVNVQQVLIGSDQQRNLRQRCLGKDQSIIEFLLGNQPQPEQTPGKLLGDPLRKRIQIKWGNTITGYTGPGGAVTIPDTITGLPVTTIGNTAFWACTSLTSATIGSGVTSIGEASFAYCRSLTSVTIPSSVTNIGVHAFFCCTSLAIVAIPGAVKSIGSASFQRCTSLTNLTIGSGVISIESEAFCRCSNLTRVTIPSTVTNIGISAFAICPSLTSVTIPNSITRIGDYAFEGCTELASMTIPNSVTYIGFQAFYDCTSLAGVYFQGNAPNVNASPLYGDNNATVYYLAGTTGWGPTFGGRPTALWLPQAQSRDASFGVQSNQFGFNVLWTSGQIVVVEAAESLAYPTWVPLQTNTLTGDSIYFNDPAWTNFPARLYRIRSQ